MDVDRLQAKETSPGSTRLKQQSEACHLYQHRGAEEEASKLILEITMKGAKNYLKISTDPTLSEAASKLINSDLKDIREATRKLVDHVIKLGVSGGFITTCLQWIACFAAMKLFADTRSNKLEEEDPYFTFGPLHLLDYSGDIGKWITLVGVVLCLFFREHYPEYLELPGSLLLLVVVAPNFVASYVRVGWIRVIVYLVIGFYFLQEHIRASGGFKNAFTKSNGISNTIDIVPLFVFPVWAIIGFIFIGRKMSEVDKESKKISYTVVCEENGNVKLACPTIGKQFDAEEISAQLVDDASKFMNDKVTKVVVTVPAYFNNSQRTATKDSVPASLVDSMDDIGEIPILLEWNHEF
ncbi:hypothetical protein Lser_V15G01155 [Lactuca serriola]